MHGIGRVLLGCLLLTLWATSLGAQWYKVPPGGNVTFTLTELWGVFKGIPPSSFVQGEATITLEYQDGSTEIIGFQDSGLGISRFVGDQGGLGLSFGTGQWSGTNVWTQTASLTAGRVFQIVLSTPAQAYTQDVEFQGGTGAFVKGFVNKFSTDAPPATQPSGPATTSNAPPAPPSPPGGAPSNIHVSGVYTVCAVSPETVEATDAYIARAQPPAALRRLLIEGRDDVLRALRCQARDRQAR
jgi:hypothetical protein